MRRDGDSEAEGAELGLLEGGALGLDEGGRRSQALFT
jgi:hypothetical protein